MSEIKGVDVNIMGRDFTVSCTDEERPGLINAVNFLDKKMRDIRDSGKVIGVERIAIMTALNLSHELLNSKSGNVDVGDIKRRITLMQDQIDQACAEKYIFKHHNKYE
jgi:cell division protein ZapA